VVTADATALRAISRTLTNDGALAEVKAFDSADTAAASTSATAVASMAVVSFEVER
jgi:hypothetical protein